MFAERKHQMTQDQPCSRYLLSVIHMVSKVLYSLFPSSICTRLASSRLGTKLGSIIAPAHDTIYECDFGIRLLLSRRDALSFGFAYMGCTNPLETKLLVQHLRRGDTLIQIGTYKEGWLALVGSQIVGSSGRVIGFEPIPEYCESFSKNVELNGSQNITIEQIAVSDRIGEATFSVAGPFSSMFLEHAISSDVVVIKTITLDAYLTSHEINSVDFLIIDTEGTETMVLNGAKQALSKATYLLMEVVSGWSQRAGITPEALVQSVSSVGFTPYIITRSGLQPWEPGKRSETPNMFFIQQEKHVRRTNESRATLG